jgi:hypothetical protein
MVELLSGIASYNDLLVLLASRFDAQVSKLLFQIWISVPCSLSRESFWSLLLRILWVLHYIFQSWLNHVLIKLLELRKVLELGLGLRIECSLLQNLLSSFSRLLWARGLSLLLLVHQALLFLFLSINSLATERFTSWFLLWVSTPPNTRLLVVNFFFHLISNSSSSLSSSASLLSS